MLGAEDSIPVEFVELLKGIYSTEGCLAEGAIGCPGPKPDLIESLLQLLHPWSVVAKSNLVGTIPRFSGTKQIGIVHVDLVGPHGRQGADQKTEGC